MAIKSVLYSFLLEDGEVPTRDVESAVAFARAHAATLTIAIASPKFEATTGFLVGEVQGMIREVNARRGDAAEKAATLIGKIAPDPASIRCQIVHEPYYKVQQRLVALARVNDLTLLSRSANGSPLDRDLAEELLFESGRPLILLPLDKAMTAPLQRVVVAWDGTARAARAVGDAIAILSEAQEVDVVSITGVEDDAKFLEGTGIAEHLSRHCRSVTFTAQPAPTGGIAAALRERMSETGADLLVMGGFAHSRIRQMVLGGVTREMIDGAPFPVLMSY
jgi:nucleotide-binding universal stress UspA family protein